MRHIRILFVALLICFSAGAAQADQLLGTIIDKVDVTLSRSFDYDFDLTPQLNLPAENYSYVTFSLAAENTQGWNVSVVLDWETPEFKQLYSFGNISSFGKNSLSQAQWTEIFDRQGYIILRFERTSGADNNLDLESITASLHTTASTPAPAAIWLLGSGLVGLVAYRRKV